jgi:hypothetical protein
LYQNVSTDTDDNNNNNNNNNNDDLFTEQASCGTSPLNSSNDTDDADANDLVYEVTDDDDVIIERPAESAQAELSAHS